MDIKYSYILPCYNVAGKIADCLNSIFKNTALSYEVIIVNDGSPDNLNDVLSEYFESKIDDGINRLEFKGKSVTVLCKENGGVSSARNSGIGLARGEYLLFADPDDELAEGSLDSIDFAVSENQPDLLITGFIIKTENKNAGETIKNVYPSRDFKTESREEVMQNVFPLFFGFSVNNIKKWGSEGVSLASQTEFGSVWRCVFKTDIIKENSIRFDPEIILHEDGMFICEYLTFAKKVYSLGALTYIYNSAPEGAMASTLFSEEKKQKLLENKISLFRFRKALAEKNGLSLESYAGSNAMSCLELMARFSLGSYKKIKAYINEPEVKASVKLMPKTKDFKFNISMLLLKYKMARLLFFAINLAKRIGVKF